MTSTDTTMPIAAPLSRARAVALLAVGAIVAGLANSVVAFAALAMGASNTFSPLLVFVYGPLTVLGLLAAYFGWRSVRARSRDPRATLRVLVPVLIVLSFTPDTILALTRFIPGTSLTAVAALMLMHLIVVAVALPVSARLAPLS